MDASKLKSAACAKVNESRELLSSVSSYLWQNPELALEERKAHQLLTETLEKSGFSVCREFVLPTGFKATFGSSAEARPHVAVMCEFDALPELGHACGHNLIAEVAVGAGLGIKAAIEASGGLQGRVTVLGTPAEETHGGKIDMIRSGFFKDVDAALMAHPDVMTTVHSVHLSCGSLRATFTGRASHAAGSPWEGVNALDAAVTAYQSVSNLRQQMRPEWRVHGIFVEGGHRPNIIPDRAVLDYSIRASTVRDSIILRKKVEACMRGAALATGCEVSITEPEPEYKNVIPNRALSQAYSANLQCLGVEHSQLYPQPTGSTDMGNVSYEAPSIHPMFYIGGSVATHSAGFTAFAGAPEAQEFALNQAKALAMTGVDMLTSAGLVERCWQTF